MHSIRPLMCGSLSRSGRSGRITGGAALCRLELGDTKYRPSYNPLIRFHQTSARARSFDDRPSRLSHVSARFVLREDRASSEPHRISGSGTTFISRACLFSTAAYFDIIYIIDKLYCISNTCCLGLCCCAVCNKIIFIKRDLQPV